MITLLLGFDDTMIDCALHSQRAVTIMCNKEINRMRWAARRGMLELDLVLGPFVEGRYLSLNAADKQLFERLMLCEDQDLLACFLRRQQPGDKELLPLVEQILEFSATVTDS